MSPIWRFFADPTTQQRLFVIGTVIVLECLVAIWAAASKRHWFWRALAVWGAVMLMVPIRAWEAAWLFGASSPLIVLLIRWGNWIDKRIRRRAEPRDATPRGHYRFTLLDLLLLVLFGGLALPGILDVVRHYQPWNWPGWLAGSASLAVLTVTAYGIAAPVQIFRRQPWASAVLAITALLAVTACVVAAGPWMRNNFLLGDSNGFSAILLLQGLFAFVMTVVLLLARGAGSLAAPVYGRAGAFMVLVLLLAASISGVAPVYREIFRQTRAEHMPEGLATPLNNYDRIMELSQHLSTMRRPSLTQGIWETQVSPDMKAPQELQDLFDEIIQLLEAPNATRYDPQTDASADSSYEKDWGVKRMAANELVKSFDLEARVAAINGEYDHAADCALALVRLGDMLSRGGLRSDAAIGNSYRKMGAVRLAEIARHLSGDKAQSAIELLQRSTAEREDLEKVQERDTYHNDRVYGWHRRFTLATERRFDHVTDLAPAFRELDLTANILLQTMLAIRKFEIDNGRPPEELAQLVPRYLPALPCDPRGNMLCYHTDDNRYLLYAVGWNNVDDGGQFSDGGDYLRSSSMIDWQSARPTFLDPLDFGLETWIQE